MPEDSREEKFARLYNLATEIADVVYEETYEGYGNDTSEATLKSLEATLDALDTTVRPVLYGMAGGEWEPHMERANERRV